MNEIKLIIKNNELKQIGQLNITLKNSLVDPPSSAPYRISVCLTRSSADSIGEIIRSTVKKAAKLAVYELMRIRVKNHQAAATSRPDIDLKEYSLLYYIFEIK